MLFDLTGESKELEEEMDENGNEESEDEETITFQEASVFSTKLIQFALKIKSPHLVEVYSAAKEELVKEWLLKKTKKQTKIQSFFSK